MSSSLPFEEKRRFSRLASPTGNEVDNFSKVIAMKKDKREIEREKERKNIGMKRRKRKRKKEVRDRKEEI